MDPHTVTKAMEDLKVETAEPIERSLFTQLVSVVANSTCLSESIEFHRVPNRCGIYAPSGKATRHENRLTLVKMQRFLSGRE
eukprot:SAG31_NODE_85_length_26982_cov_19.325485_9_plen_82_part_00